MSRRLLALLAVAAPLAARPGSYTASGAVDAGYATTEVSSAGGSARVGAWDYGVQLTLGAAPIRPDLLQASGSVNYRWYQADAAAQGHTTTLGYSAGLSALQGLPLSLSATASRTNVDFDASSGATLTGSTRSTSQAASALLHLPDEPVVSASVSRAEFDNLGVAGLRTGGASTVASLAASHSLENHAWSAAYETSWNDGTYADSDYKTHRASLSGQARPTGALEVRLTEQLYLREPTVAAASSPRFDDNLFGADALWRPSSRLVGTAGYSYHRLAAAFRGLGQDQGATSQGLRAGADWAATGALTVSGTLAAGQVETTLGPTVVRSTGQSLGGGLRWIGRTGASTWNLDASGSTGLTQQDGPDARAWGAAAGAGWSSELGGWAASLSASSGYDTNLLGQRGWALRNLVSATADRTTEAGLRLRSQLQVSDARQHDPLLGDTTAQLLQLLGHLGWRASSASVSAGLTSAAAQGLSSPGGGLTLPLQANTRTRFATLSATTALTAGLSLAGLARWLAVTAPGRPDTWETALNLRLTYRLGLFDLSAEDRWSVGAQGGPQFRVNVLMARLTRSFGARL